MASKVYFGNDNKQTWILAPKGEMSTTATSKTTMTDLLNGRRHIKRSHGSSRSFSVSWLGSMNSTDMTESLHTVKDFADGIYGSTKLYWLDPFAMSSNLMPPHWAAPMLSENDWPALVSDVTPTFTAASYANSYPIKYATYSLTAGKVGDRKLTLIIPAGYTLHFGWHATSSGVSASTAAGVRVKLYNRSTGSTTDANPSSLLAGGTTRTNYTVSGNTYNKVEIFIANGGSSTSSLNISGMIAQILADGLSVDSGGFVTGRGTTALDFSDSVEIQYYTAAMMDGMIGLSTTLMEVD